MSVFDYTVDNVPDLECPACLYEHELDDYYDLGKGSDFQCARCSATLVCIEVETVTRWRWRVADDNADSRDNRK